MKQSVELPRPAPFLRTVGWNLTEAVGLPVAAYAVGAWLGGRDVGLWAMLAAIWLTVIIRRFVSGSVPGLVMISAIVLTLQTAVAVATGNLWIFLLHFPAANLCLGILFAWTARGPSPLCARLAAEVIGLRQPVPCPAGLHRFFQHATAVWAGIFLLLAATLGALLATVPIATYVTAWTVTTIVLLAAGAGASGLWFRLAMRRLGIGVCFAQAAPAPSGTPRSAPAHSAPPVRARPGMQNYQP